MVGSQTRNPEALVFGKRTLLTSNGIEVVDKDTDNGALWFLTRLKGQLLGTFWIVLLVGNFGSRNAFTLEWNIDARIKAFETVLDARNVCIATRDGYFGNTFTIR